MNNKTKVFLPILLAMAIVLGMYINPFFQQRTGLQSFTMPATASSHKLDAVLNMIVDDYVDTVSAERLVEQAIPAILKNLDPHTVYIPKEDLQRINEDLNGNFGGIGVQYITYRDTVTVVKAIEGGPSDSAGVLAGDRIVKVDTTPIVGADLSTEFIQGKLKGRKGTGVKVQIVRRGVKDLIDLDIIRGSIPVASVDVAYMINKDLGYIKVDRFGATTYHEFSVGLEKLKEQGLKKLIVDLRGNSGGYMSAATNMINEFLPKGKMIVYTEGKSQSKTDYVSTGSGNYQDLPIVVLIDEGSASASEIFAGAIQDNDRGEIIGRRSFGKGLVQEQRSLPDGSALRLTVARYYTPTGRCIQKSYSNGKAEYNNDITERFIHGEFEQQDSIHFADSLKFKTPEGNIVYGGGGIMPDIFIPVDTAGYSKYFIELNRKGLIHRFAFYYVDEHRAEMERLLNVKDILNYLDKKPLIKELTKYCEDAGVKTNNKGLNYSLEIIDTQMKAYIARNIIDDDGFYPIIQKIDKTLDYVIDMKD
ncbi:S41 family peptidase [Ancylomarina sp. 16SWW S1-10-2]|uniref:S41 family peptidase n=1 Tax=Ancylomarina sp. 16SWW S1-10-2 TaxID=2499681 RepID=UPI0012ADE76F|nr:S41 family peptidase [Ancylomarina sp. 16SWW S1-10-2]MRT92187.1 S41 family peptidase [Ancylomarina sp. 16SWW S1-10-2]